MRTFVLAGLLVALTVAVARGETFPSADAYHDAPSVALIVEARIVAGDRVAVTRTLHAAAPLPEGTTELRVEGLSKLDRVPDPSGRHPDTTKPVVPDEAVLLLERSGDAWRPLHFIDCGPPRGGCGATGAYLVLDGKVWCYDQTYNPGPYRLVTWPYGAKTQGTVEQLRAVIAAGLAAQRAWDEDVATKDPAERAKRLVRWLSEETSPDKDEHPATRADWAGGELQRIGAPAVPVLLEALKTTDDKSLGNGAVQALGGMHQAAKDAVPRLVELAAAPGKLHLQWIARALAEIADERAIPTFRRLLAETPKDDKPMMEVVVRGLRACKDPDAEELIKAKSSTD
jgi:HEAT repeat protein